LSICAYQGDAVCGKDEHVGDEVRRRQTLLLHPGEQEFEAGLVEAEKRVEQNLRTRKREQGICLLQAYTDFLAQFASIRSQRGKTRAVRKAIYIQSGLGIESQVIFHNFRIYYRVTNAQSHEKFEGCYNQALRVDELGLCMKLCPSFS